MAKPKPPKGKKTSPGSSEIAPDGPDPDEQNKMKYNKHWRLKMAEQKRRGDQRMIKMRNHERTRNNVRKNYKQDGLENNETGLQDRT
jgi:hypothetical protein